MYLRSITLKNTGPIRDLELHFPFDDDKPKPLVLVGRNGSGKSTLISFIVNALIGLKQQVFEDVEVEKGKVYRLRSPLGIHGDANFYMARLNFDKGVSLVEWQLNKSKQQFTEQDGLQHIDPSWAQIPVNENSFYSLPLGELAQPHVLEEALTQTCHLFFPADRFEPPDWLNSENLSSELKLPEPSRMKGRTERRIFSRNRLKPTLEWLNSVIFDMMVSEHQPVQLQVPGTENVVEARLPIPGKANTVFQSVVAVLSQVLCHDPSDKLQLSIGDRRTRIISATVRRQGEPVTTIKDLMSLSAGESALFCLFTSIIRDADLSSMQFNTPADISGIVLIDEADLHLHLSMQNTVLPRLIALFPRIQFVISVHAPMVAIGMEKVLGKDGFEIREMPSGTLVTPETYSEFLTAFNLFASTKKFQEEILAKVSEGIVPALLVEGKTDAVVVATAWEKLNPGVPMPFEAIPCGVEPIVDERNGGADMLRRCTEFLSIVTDRPITTLFDNDSAGSNHFNSLSAKAGFEAGKDAFHKRHRTKPMHAVVLPTPAGREDFSSAPKPANRYLVIEHYFSDAILAANGLKGAPVLAGTSVFEIDANSKQKVAFAEKLKELDPKEFTTFAVLFDRLAQIVA